MSQPERKRLITLIHVAKRDLKLSDDQYRWMLGVATEGKESTKDMTLPELEKCLEYFKQKGFVIQTKKTSSGKLSPQSRHKEVKEPKDKIRALWINLYQAGKVRDRTEAGLNHFVHSMTGVERVEWLNVQQGIQVIEGLKAWLKREPKPEESANKPPESSEQ